MKAILEQQITFYEHGEPSGADLTTANTREAIDARDKYKFAEASMRALVVSSLDRRYATQVVSLPRFINQWQKVESAFVGERSTQQVILMAKLRQTR